MKSSIPTETPLHAAANETEEQFYMPYLGRFKFCSLILGYLVGLFIYLSTLGAEFVAVMLWGKDILNKSNQDLILFSLGWNLVTTIIALIILSSLRRLVLVVFSAAMHGRRSNADDVASELMGYLEGRFAVGALIGICVSWNVTNYVLGMRPQIIQSCIILAVACLWCRLTLFLLGQSSANNNLIYDNDDEEDSDDSKDDKLEPLLDVEESSL